MKRRDLIRGAAIAAGALSAPAIARDEVTLKMVTSWPGRYAGLGTTADRFARSIERASGGRFQIKMFPSGTLVHPLRVHDAVRDGAADIYHSADHYFMDRAPAYALFCAAPFGLRADEFNAWVQHGGGQALWDDLGGVFGIKHLLCGNTGPQSGGWYMKVPDSAGDFSTLKMRINGLAADVMAHLGAEVHNMTGSEAVRAMQAGELNAAEWMGPWHDLELGLHKVGAGYAWPGWQRAGMALSLGISRTFWDTLSPADRVLFEQCAEAENSRCLAEFTAANATALNSLKKQFGIEPAAFSDDALDTLGFATREVLDRHRGDDRFFRKVLESQQRFQELQGQWSALADGGIGRYRALAAAGKPAD